MGDSGANVRGSDLLSSPPQCRINAGLVMLHKYTPMEFSVLKSRAMTPQVPLCRAFSRAVVDENSLSSLFPVGWGLGVGEQWLQMTGA